MTLKDLLEAEHSRIASGNAAGQKGSPKESPLSDGEYRKECSVFPAGFLDNVFFDALVPDDYKLFWPDETICCLAVLPFNDGFYGKKEMDTEGKWESFLHDLKFLRLLTVMPLTKLTSGIGNAGEPAGRYFELLPEILRKDVDEGGCSFYMKHEDPSVSGNAKDRKQFIAQCEKALSNLKKFLGV